MLSEVSDLAEGSSATFVITLMWLLLCVRHQMAEELGYTMDNFVTFSIIIIFFVATFENFILLFQII
jgi:hypothetical protein